MRYMALTVVLAVLAGCSGMRGPVPEDDLRTTKRVGIVSTLGGSTYGVYRGVTVFNNAGFVAPVPEWQIDKFVTDTALTLLRSNPRFEIAPLDLPPGYTSLSPTEKDAVLWPAAKQQRFDRLLILSPGVSDNFAMYRPGYGLFEMSLFGLPRYCMYVAYVASVYDVATQKRLGWEWGGPQPCVLSGDGIPFKPKFDDYTDSEKASMRAQIEARLSATLPYALDGVAPRPASNKSK